MKGNVKRFLAISLCISMVFINSLSYYPTYADDMATMQQENSETSETSLLEQLMLGEVSYANLSSEEKVTLFDSILYDEENTSWFLSLSDEDINTIFGMSLDDLCFDVTDLYINVDTIDERLLSVSDEMLNKLFECTKDELQEYINTKKGEPSSGADVPMVTKISSGTINVREGGVSYPGGATFDGSDEKEHPTQTSARFKLLWRAGQPTYRFTCASINGGGITYQFPTDYTQATLSRSDVYYRFSASPDFKIRDYYYDLVQGGNPWDTRINEDIRKAMNDNGLYAGGSTAPQCPSDSEFFHATNYYPDITAPSGKQFSPVYQINTKNKYLTVNLSYTGNCTLWYKENGTTWREIADKSAWLQGTVGNNGSTPVEVAFCADSNSSEGIGITVSTRTLSNAEGFYIGNAFILDFDMENGGADSSVISATSHPQAMVAAEGISKTVNSSYTFTPKTGSATLTKKSLCPNMTWNNGVYNINGAVYSVYAVSSASDKSTSNKVAEFTIKDESGTGGGNNGCPGYVTYTKYNQSDINTKTLTGLPFGYYMCKETKKPDSGYSLSSKYYYIHVTESKTYVFHESDASNATDDEKKYVIEPVENDPVSFEIKKQDSVTGEVVQGGGSLEGAVFRVRYYDTLDPMIDNTTGKITNGSKRTWYFVTKKNTATGSYWFSYNPRFLSSDYTNSTMYTDSDGRYTLPLGTISIEEVKAPEGYTLENAYIDSQGKKYTNNYIIIKIKQSGQNIGKYNVYNQAISEDILVNEKVIRGDVEFTKQDYETRELMAGVPFRITNTDTGELIGRTEMIN